MTREGERERERDIQRERERESEEREKEKGERQRVYDESIECGMISYFLPTHTSTHTYIHA